MNENTKTSVSNWYRMTAFLRRYRHVLILCPLLFAAVLLVSGIFSLEFPAVGEALMYNTTIIVGLLQFGFTATVILFGIGAAALFATLLMEWSIQRLAAEIRLAALAKQLPQYEGGDFLCIQNLENGAETIRSANAIEKALPIDSFMGLLLYQSNAIVVKHKTKGGVVEQVIERKDFVPDFPSTDFTTESESTFWQYVRYARPAFQNFCAAVRVKEMAQLGQGAGAYIAQTMKTVCLALFLLFSVGLSAQSKTERVNTGLGAAAQVVPKAGATVVYTFQNGGVTRTADGKLTVAQLVASGRIGADADDKGALLGVDIAGLAITAAPQTKAAQPEQPKPLFQTRKEAVLNAVPDSIEFKEKLSRMDEMMQKMVDSGLANGISIAASKTFYYGIHFLIFFAFVCQFISNSAVNESRLGFYNGIKYGKTIYRIGSFFRLGAWLGLVACSTILLTYIFYCLAVENGLAGIFWLIISWNTLKLGFAVLAVFAVERVSDILLKNPKTEGGGYSGHNERGGNPRLNG
jgi:hypothetical protein